MTMSFLPPKPTLNEADLTLIRQIIREEVKAAIGELTGELMNVAAAVAVSSTGDKVALLRKFVGDKIAGR